MKRNLTGWLLATVFLIIAALLHGISQATWLTAGFGLGLVWLKQAGYQRSRLYFSIGGVGGEEEDDDGEGFEKKMLSGVKKLTKDIEGFRQQQEEITTNFDNLSKESKKAVEELTKLKETSNSLTELTRSIERVQQQFKREQRMAFGDPMRRLLDDDEKSLRLSCAFALAMDKDGDMRSKCRDLLKAAGLTEVAKGIMQQRTGIGEDTSPGSTLITPELSKDVYDTLAMYGAWNTLGVRRMGTKQQKLIQKTVRPVALIVDEGVAIDEDGNKAGNNVTATAKVIAVLLSVSLQVLEDSIIDLSADVLDDFVEAFNYRLDFISFMGTGAANSTSGGFTGLFNAGTAAVAGAGNTSVAALQLEDYVRCLTTVDPIVIQRAARWWMHPTMLARTVLVRDKQGRSLFQTMLETPAPGGIGSILGYPVTLAFVAPNTDGANKQVAAFGDPRSQSVGVRRDFVFESSDHYHWNTLQRAFRGWGRAATINRSATGSAILTTAAA
jgi:HK97 family phage major capsid protein